MVTEIQMSTLFKSTSEIKAYEKEKAELFKEVNRGMKHPVDYSVFKKSPEEKIKTWEMKMEWKKLQRLKNR